MLYNIILFVGAMLILFVFLKLIGIKTKVAFRFMLNSILGGLILFLICKFGNKVGVDITLDGISSMVTGVLGIPGMIIMVVLKAVGFIA